MNVPPALVTGLRALVHGDLDEAALLHRRLDGLVAALRSAAPSLLGFAITVPVGREPVRLDLVVPDPGPTGTSMALPLDWLTGSPGSELVVYAGVPGALVDLAADLDFVLPAGVKVVLDRHLGARPPVSGTAGVDRVATTNVAIGIMIDQGMLPQEALTALTHRAVTLGISVAEAADEVVEDARAQAAARGLTG